MNMNRIIGSLFPGVLTHVRTSEKRLFLSFDDGPSATITPELLRLLSDWNAKATFFCTGAKVQKYPKLLQEIENAGHAIGNHGHEHLSGWKTGLKTYLNNVHEADDILKTAFFRPPYGHLGLRQYLKIRKKYKIITWDVMARDFHAKWTVERSVKHVISRTKKGSIIVLHDSEQAGEKMLQITSQLLAYYAAKGYCFSALSLEDFPS